MGRLQCLLDGVHYRPVLHGGRYDNNVRAAGGPHMEKLKKLLRPPCGNEVRKAAAIFTLWVGVPRLPIFSEVPFNPLRFADQWVYGIVMTVVGILLLATCWNGYRHTIGGKVIAGIAFVCWSMLAAATMSITSFGINLTMAIILLTEVWKNGPCGYD